MNFYKRIISCFLCVVIIFCSTAPSFVARASLLDSILYNWDAVGNWLADPLGNPLGGWNAVDYLNKLFQSNKPQKYYTEPSSSVEDQYGNVTNYYRGGDTTTTKIIDSYNHTFNTIHNTTNTTNKYSANVKLSDFLNSYTTNTNNYTYNTDYNSWYYDQSTQNYTYDASQTYYNTDNSRYYISIDNSTDEYYLVDIQYSPTFVTVNYNYNNINGSTDYGDVTNVYYYELTDGRNSSVLTVSEVLGLDLGLDVTNYVQIADDNDVLSLQHFDGTYEDSSVYNRDFYSVNRSTTYVDSGSFGKAVKLISGSAAGVTIPGLSDYESLMIDFRIYYNKISDLGIYFGDTNLFSQISSYRKWNVYDYYSDHGQFFENTLTYNFSYYEHLSSSEIGWNGGSSNIISEFGTIPTQFESPGFSINWDYKYGISSYSAPRLFDTTTEDYWLVEDKSGSSSNGVRYYDYKFTYNHFVSKEYRSEPVCFADFNYDSYINQWIPMRIVLSGGMIYYFVNGDLVGSGSFAMPEGDRFYIKSSGTLYLDELRICTGDMVSISPYNPSSAPYDTNQVLALPDDPDDLTIYVRHSCPIRNWRIGGVRPSNPTTGFFYIPLHADYSGAQSQIYDGNNWIDVDSVVIENGDTYNTLGYVFSPVSQSPDIAVDVDPGGSGSDTTSNCTHDWQRTESVDATCKTTGKATYTCTKCDTTKTEVLPMISHAWEVKITVPTTYDDSGNIVTEGYTIYRCNVCGEEYKDTDGSGPPLRSPSSGSDSDSDEWDDSWLSKIGDAIKKFFSLIGSIIGNLLDALLNLLTLAVEKLTQVLDLFGAFGDALRALWSWLPDEVITVLVAGVTIIVFAAIIKLFV